MYYNYPHLNDYMKIYIVYKTSTVIIILYTFFLGPQRILKEIKRFVVVEECKGIIVTAIP